MKIETKFNIGDCVYFMSSNTVQKDFIQAICILIPENQFPEIKYAIPSHYYSQDKIFASKEELLKSL